MIKLLPAFLALALISCSQQFHCKKCLAGNNVIRDTLTVRDTVVTASVRIDTTVVYDLSTDTLVIEKDRVKIKFRDLPGPTVYLAAECPSDTVILEKKVPVETEVHTGFTLWHLVLSVLAGAGLVALLLLFKR